MKLTSNMKCFLTLLTVGIALVLAFTYKEIGRDDREARADRLDQLKEQILDAERDVATAENEVGRARAILAANDLRREYAQVNSEW